MVTTPTLTARLLAEIERRDRGASIDYNAGMPVRDVLLYLAALRKIVERHRVYLVAGDRLPICAHCDRRYPCVELMDVAAALDVAP